jgi:multiple antibiotic resistance protein
LHCWPSSIPSASCPFSSTSRKRFSAAERQRTIRISSFTAFVVIATSALAGLKVIEFFGISLASFQVGGGTLLLISSLAMLNAQPAESKPGDMSDGDERSMPAPASRWCR